MQIPDWLGNAVIDKARKTSKRIPTFLFGPPNGTRMVDMGNAVRVS